ncbi:hypothetical protein E3T28_09975 [Cryobacterium sinapicolor]|uniref:Iron ABC transporter permease n=2 Tax=Microbacteriaceae TaxID=85023 RepID=A0ABY2J1I6_9MICO|nr:hypothetical protein E3O67_06545 [Cryobacterium sp. TMT3-29-2]TFC98800.1 hypothetical protein E3T28_09975 [Cryobacterium sinapicolor]
MLGGLLILTVLVSSSAGPVQVSAADSLRIIVGHLVPGMPWMVDGSVTVLQDQAVWQFRLPRVLILSGVALGSLFSAVTSYLTITTDAQNVFSVLFFLLGSVSAVTMNQLAAPAVVLVAVLLLALLQGRALNALLMGDEAATSLGVSVQRLRGGLLVATALLTGTILSVAGGIGFVGLVIPHVCRILVGSDHRRMLPAAVLAGGCDRSGMPQAPVPHDPGGGRGVDHRRAEGATQLPTVSRRAPRSGM